jgi:hypothetical protein
MHYPRILEETPKKTTNSLIASNLPNIQTMYSKTSIHRFRQGSENVTMDPGKQ